MTTLVLLALLAQTADAALTCDRLGRGGREVNPLLGQSCARVSSLKAAALGASVLLPPAARRAWLVGLTVGGGVGVTVTLVLER